MPSTTYLIYFCIKLNFPLPSLLTLMITTTEREREWEGVWIVKDMGNLLFILITEVSVKAVSYTGGAFVFPCELKRNQNKTAVTVSSPAPEGTCV